MNKNLASLLLLLFAGSLCAAQKGPEQAELARFAAMIKKDTAALKGMLSPDLRYIHSNGLVENYHEHLKNVGSGKITYRTMARQAVRVHRSGKTAVVNGQVAVAGLIDGKPFDVLLHYTAVYRKSKRQWKLWSWQSTKS